MFISIILIDTFTFGPPSRSGAGLPGADLLRNTCAVVGSRGPGEQREHWKFTNGEDCLIWKPDNFMLFDMDYL